MKEKNIVVWCDVQVLFGSFYWWSTELYRYVTSIAQIRKQSISDIASAHVPQVSQFAVATRPTWGTTELPMDYSSIHEFSLFQNAYTGFVDHPDTYSMAIVGASIQIQHFVSPLSLQPKSDTDRLIWRLLNHIKWHTHTHIHIHTYIHTHTHTHTNMHTRTHAHTHTHTHHRTRLKEWSAHGRGRYLHKTRQTQETNIHAFSGIRNRDPSNRASTDPRHRPHGH